MRNSSRHLLAVAALGLATVMALAAPAGASASLTISGTDSSVGQKPRYVPCASGAGECGTVQLDGLGTAQWDYVFGPTFTPDGRCYDDDGTITFTLSSDGSTVSGPVTGVFCPKPSSSSQGGDNSWGNPFVEDVDIAFSGGTGRFAGLSGIVQFHTESAGARTRTSFHGTLTD